MPLPDLLPFIPLHPPTGWRAVHHAAPLDIVALGLEPGVVGKNRLIHRTEVPRVLHHRTRRRVKAVEPRRGRDDGRVRVAVVDIHVDSERGGPPCGAGGERGLELRALLVGGDAEEGEEVVGGDTEADGNVLEAGEGPERARELREA